MPKIEVLPHAELCPEGATFEAEKGVSICDNLLNHGIEIEHVGDVARLALVEADQHAAFLRDVTHRQPRAVPVAPRRPVDRRQQRRRPHAGDVPQRVLERALLRRDLGHDIEMLERAASADAEVGTARQDAVGTRAKDRFRACEFPRGLALERRDRRSLAGQGALDEDRLPVDARDATAFLVERFDVGYACRSGGIGDERRYGHRGSLYVARRGVPDRRSG